VTVSTEILFLLPLLIFVSEISAWLKRRFAQLAKGEVPAFERDATQEPAAASN
jgi:hypothetical protein